MIHAAIYLLSFAGVMNAGQILSTDGEQSSTVRPSSVSSGEIDPVLALAPSDAFFVTYLSDLTGLRERPAWKAFLKDATHAATLLESWHALSDGRAMLAVSGAPVNPLSWRMTIAANCHGDRSALYAFLTNEFLPAWNASPLANSIGEMSFQPVGETARITVVGRFSFLLTVAVRDGVMFASNRLGETDRWVAGGAIGSSFVGTDAFDRMTAQRAVPIGELVYLDLRTLVPVVTSQMESDLAGLPEALQLTSVEWAGLVADGVGHVDVAHTDGVDAHRPKRHMPRRMHLALGFAEEPVGVWRILASAPRSPSLARSIPSDFTVFFSGGMQNAAQIVRHAFAFLGKIDSVFEEEYTAERKEFQAEVGFDLESDFLANLVDSWAVGFPVSDLESAVWAVRIRDVSLLSGHLSGLRAAFDLEETQRLYRGVTMSMAASKNAPFAYAIVEDILLVSPSVKALRRAVDANLDDTGLHTLDEFQRALRPVSSRASKHGFVNIGAILDSEIEAQGTDDVPQAILDWVRGLQAAGSALTSKDRTIFLEMATANENPAQLVDLMAMIVVPSIARSRALSQRAVSMSNVKNLVTACIVFAADHDKQWPASWGELEESGILGDGDAVRQLLANPYRRSSDSRKPFYVYRQPDAPSVEGPSETAVICEPAVHDGGCVCGFMDGHAEWVESARAERLLNDVRRGR